MGFLLEKRSVASSVINTAARGGESRGPRPGGGRMCVCGKCGTDPYLTVGTHLRRCLLLSARGCYLIGWCGTWVGRLSVVLALAAAAAAAAALAAVAAAADNAAYDAPRVQHSPTWFAPSCCWSTSVASACWWPTLPLPPISKLSVSRPLAATQRHQHAP